MRITPDRNCSICGVAKTPHWYRHSKPEHYICHACYNRQQKIKKMN
uniref:GATA-type domain-containing protein n=1 Tax=Meloidogyne enterolobii TaxID=390850 RepID=A0A6V7VI06_MELEN|nr:unnamed protein product [Meloidogyne enterolobii]